MEALKELYLKKSADFACEPIGAFLADLDASAGTGLEVVQLNGNSKRLFNNRVSYMQVVALCESLYEDTIFRELDLSYNRLDDLAAQAVARLIKMNRCITRINLTGNELTQGGAAHLAEALSSSDVVLEVLQLGGNGDLGDAGVSSLGSMLRKNTSLLTLDINGTGAGIKGLISICTALGASDEPDANKTLLSLDIGNPLLRTPQDTTTLSIAQMLAVNTTLEELGLSKHGLVDSNFETLVTYGLMRNSTITSLDLRSNKISAFSGPFLERLLNDKHQIVSINLASNQLGDSGALSIARSLPYMQQLSHLDVRSNNIGEPGLVALAESLSLASNLQVFLLWGNNFGPSACRAFLDTLAQLERGSGTGGPPLIIDIQPYEVDGVAQVALRDV